MWAMMLKLRMCAASIHSNAESGARQEIVPPCPPVSALSLSATGYRRPQPRKRKIEDTTPFGAHIDTAPGPRTVPVRSVSARGGGLQKVSDSVPGHALRTG